MHISRPAGATLSRNTIVTVIASLLYLLTRVGLPPLILASISVEEYGIWSSCFILISYIGMGAFGVSNAYIRFSAEFSASNEMERIGRLISAGLVLTLSMSAVVLWALWLSLPWVMHWFNVSAAYWETARILILGTVATMLLDLTFGAFGYVLNGLQRIAETKFVWIISYLIETALTVVLLLNGGGVFSLLWAFLVRYLFSTVLYVILVFRWVPGFRLHFRGLRRSDFEPFLHFGGALQLSGMISVVLYSIEKILAGRLTGVGAVAILDVGQKIPMMGSQVFSAFTSSFMPAVAHLHTLGEHRQINDLYVRSIRYMNLLIGTAMGFIAGFGDVIIRAWVGDKPELAEMSRVILSATIGFQFHELTGPASAYYQGIDRPWRPFEYSILQLAGIAVIVGVILHKGVYSIVAIAVGAAMTRVVAGTIYLLRTCRSMGLSQADFIWRGLLPGLLPYLWGIGLAYLASPWLPWQSENRMTLLGILLGMGCLYAIWTLGFFWFVQVRRDERQNLTKTLLRRNATT